MRSVAAAHRNLYGSSIFSDRWVDFRRDRRRDRLFLASSIHVNGPLVEAFEHKFAAYCGLSYGIGVSSGTTGLELPIFR